MFTKIEFVTLTLSDAQKKSYKKWLDEHLDEFDQIVTTLILSGHKVGISFDGKNNSFICSVTCRDEGSLNFNKCTSSRHASIVEVVMLAAYKELELFAGQNWSTASQETSWG